MNESKNNPQLIFIYSQPKWVHPRRKLVYVTEPENCP